MTRLLDQCNPGKVEILSIVRNPRLMETKAYCRQNRVAASVHDLRAPRRSLMAFNVLHTQNRINVGFVIGTMYSLSYVNCFPRDPCVFQNLALGPVVMYDALFEQFHESCPLSRRNILSNPNSSHPLGRRATKVCVPVLRCSIEKVASSTLSTRIGGSAFFG